MLKRNDGQGPKISVVIITHNRKEILKECLAALFSQTYPENDYEIVVVDDGSTDDTHSTVRSIAESSPVSIRYFRQENKGVAAARNHGIKRAESEICLLIGDDIVATPTLVEEHVNWHKRYGKENQGVLGYVTWSPEIEVTDFMWWLENGGPLLGYSRIMDKIQVDFRFFYTGNISLKTSYLKDNLFCEEFFFGYADTELGYRLSKRGFKLYFNQDAIAYHHHPTTFEDFQKRMTKWGKTGRIFLAKYPELKSTVRVYPAWFLKVCRCFAALLYPLANVLGWSRMIYYHRYQIRLMTIYSRTFFESKRDAGLVG
ncbi:MAG: glycosyltransferase family 2 protein [Candidatus Zixiibacteriota bacterium]|nr:MAG: glycosyltransferase family 2 protein [candidate division Zixibacteria bacterium]